MQITLIDTFIVSEESKPALLEAGRTIQGILKTTATERAEKQFAVLVDPAEPGSTKP